MDELPLEIVQEIIECSARSNRHQAATLSRVSRAVNDWVRPHLLKSLIYYEDSEEDRNFHPVPSLSWFETNGKYVRNMLWRSGVAKLPPILELCPHLENLALWTYISEANATVLLPILSTLPLRQISVNLQALFSGSDFQNEQGRNSMFRCITHLDIIQRCTEWSQIEGTAQLPCLTHLSILQPSDNVGAVSGALEHCARLRILALLRFSTIQYQRNVRHIAEENAILCHCSDPRVVGLMVEVIGDWDAGAMGGRDMWVIAEEIVAKRLQGWREVVSTVGVPSSSDIK
ncbi:hypothetical protein BDN72DRAFT_127077 [Pluteus cervinus]|uniref:Uncharacterized protein n=1 Tax=Pluteus cervinus TaxID=181527 RepID=A0ACD3AMH7_9AGAR|nr:hypothetical protein BDN72DRAFT_127077 [Pluteus cervinus]